MNAKRKYEHNNLPYCCLNQACCLPIMNQYPRCQYTLNQCISNKTVQKSEYILGLCDRFEAEMAEFLDYIYTGGDNVKVKEPVFGRYYREAYKDALKAGDA